MSKVPEYGRGEGSISSSRSLIVFIVSSLCKVHFLYAHNLPLRIDVAAGVAGADVDLILRGLLVHRVVKVDGVAVLQAPLSP